MIFGLVLAGCDKKADRPLPNKEPRATQSATPNLRVTTTNEIKQLSFGELRAEAESGVSQAQTELAMRYADGTGVAQDLAEAIKWLRKAAEQGNYEAQLYLGVCYLKGLGVPKDEAEAKKWFRKTQDQDRAEAQLALADLYLSTGEKACEGEAFELYRKAAEHGSVNAQLSLALCYFKGVGVTNDAAEARKWIDKASENGSTEAQLNIGDMYRSKIGDPAEALKWYRKAAEHGNTQALYRVGNLYEYERIDVGKWAERYSEAINWYTKAAEQGILEAQLKLGDLYSRNWALKNDVEAVRWTRRAAEQGSIEAQWGLGYHYETGRGVPQDHAEAAKWYRKAAERGYVSAQLDLGKLYANGQGVPQDFIEAYKWLNLASVRSGGAIPGLNGEVLTVPNEPATLRDRLAATMTSEQLAEGQRRAAAFQRRNEVGQNDTNSPADVRIDEREAIRSSGTGFFISEDGFLITNEHVVKDATQVRLSTSAGLTFAKIVRVDSANDLALLKAQGKFAALPVAASRTVRLGNSVATVGFPNIGLQGFAPKLAKGEIASLSGAQDDARYFQISVPVQPGNSGGALVDERGNVVGVVSAKLSARAALAASGSLPENVNYAVKSSFLLGFLESVPEVSAKLKEPKSPQTPAPKFEDVVRSAEQAAVLVLVY